MLQKHKVKLPVERKVTSARHWTLSSVCVHRVWVHREIWTRQCVLLFSWPPHCVYLSVVKMPYAKWACVTALVSRRTIGPTHTLQHQSERISKLYLSL